MWCQISISREDIAVRIGPQLEQRRETEGWTAAK